MKESYVYEAEYISTIDGLHYLNVDLGFRIWSVQPFSVTNLDNKEYKPGTRLLIQTEALETRKPIKYTCEIL